MDPESFFITGIGASAGGTTALQSFFQNIEGKPGTAFIIIQHLAIDQKGFTKESLKDATLLPILQVDGRTKIEKNHIYLIPPQYYLLMQGSYLELKPRDPEKKINDAIDVFFRSLADQAEEKAIGIIFSGLGSDGAKGVQMIKERGGIVMVQSPDSATFRSMPVEAIMSDSPDVIDSPANIAKDLIRLIKQPSIITADAEVLDPDQGDAIQKIISLVNEFSGVNFREYKINTIIRRIDKRLKINYLKSPLAYFKLLGERPEEIRILFNDFLIGVTEFFRDKEAFNALKELVIPELCRTENEFETLRIWVPACSTGEEAYSIAMLFDYYIRENNLQLDFKIFATDLDQKAIEMARRGRYSTHVELQVPEHLFKAYFNQKGEFFEISNEIRKKVIFSVQNLLNDPPFIRINLISCRNLFIYLKEEVQKKLIYTFNYSLLDGGYLLIGPQETYSDLIDLFEIVDSQWKLFKNKKISGGIKSEIIQNISVSKFRYGETGPPPRPKPAVFDPQQELFAELILEKYAPDCLLLTKENDVVYVSGKADDYLVFPKRKENLKLFDMVSDNTSLALRNGLRQVKEDQRNVVLREVHAMNKYGKPIVADFFFYSIYSNKTAEKYIIIEIKKVDEKKDDQEFIEVSSRESLREIERLETELVSAKRDLKYNLEELETINEELQSSNEEMKSSNEEMQTTNEELQSANEELKTVNYELKAKIDEITVLHDDVENLFFSTQIATLFLDRNMNIRKFTPAVQNYFNIRESDIGRPIYHYTHNFGYLELEIDVEKVLQTLQPMEREIETNNGYAIIKIIPYKTDDRRIEGIILTFVDVSPLKKSNLKLNELAVKLKKRTSELERLEKYWKSLVENTPDIVARLDENATIKFVNQSLLYHTGIEPSKLIGKSLVDLNKCSESDEIKDLFQKVDYALKNKKTVNFNQNFTLQEGHKNFFVTVIPEQNDSHLKLDSLLFIARNITNVRSVEIKFDEKSSYLEEANQYMDNFVHAVAHDLRAPLTNLKLILELIEDEEKEEKRELLKERLNNAVTRIDDILNGLVEIIECQENISEKVRKVKFNQVIKKSLAQFKEVIPNDALIKTKLEVDGVFHIRPYVFSIVRNLLSNCIKYRRQDIPLKINLETKKEGNYIVLSVEDNGIGINLKGKQEDLFQPFKRFTTVGEGIGIGLNIVKSMVEKTGGHIDVESEVGRGTKFLIYFKDLKEENPAA